MWLPSPAAWRLALKENTSGGRSTKHVSHVEASRPSQPNLRGTQHHLHNRSLVQVSQCGQLWPNSREVALQTSMWDERYYCGHLWKMQHATGHMSSMTQYHKRDGAMREGLCLLDVPRDARGRLGQGSGVPLSEASTRVSRSPYLWSLRSGTELSTGNMGSCTNGLAAFQPWTWQLCHQDILQTSLTAWGFASFSICGPPTNCQSYQGSCQSQMFLTDVQRRQLPYYIFLSCLML